MKGLMAAAGAALLLLAACATPTVLPATPGAPSPSASVVPTTEPASSGTPSTTPTPVLPSPLPSAEVTCSEGDQPLSQLPGRCSEQEQAALAAVADLGFPVKTIDISPFGWPCGVPFPGTEPRACPLARNGPTAYATFFGTDKVAALTFSHGTGGSVVATVIAFQVPPTGPAPA